MAAHTYVLPKTVAAQQAPGDYPSEWGEGLPADYAIDPEIGDDADLMHNALTAIPSMSIAVDPEHLFDAETGIYTNTENDGVEWALAAGA